MKKYLTISAMSILSSIIIYMLIYMIAVFIRWEFYNPIEWIIDMPNYMPSDRITILFSLICYQIMNLAIAFNILKKYN